ncbi:DUF5996 family protein [Chitinophaga pinensis]|uniref:Ava_C0101 and related proteins n=1 Tax=Chitinophaga pinensis (strain ATCC 43595 / DSM 2588 / LMG 13176 / NBRC 15968 / NCIMB 11800 / UQM 2034) TaxID=485918 RepID=A0A979G3G2_CHIPD|nr:DUF5996 family protein [Chitinophaga pinensis]ACU59978.1 conserved hypothetical protein [Chitinophaga pinensis DSM 2588]
MKGRSLKQDKWPVLKFDDLKGTLAAVHLWTQVVGKIRLRKMPWLNHSWHVTLYVTANGLSSGSMPYEHGIFQMDFDFHRHQLVITASTGGRDTVDLAPGTVAGFYNAVITKLKALDIHTAIYTTPSELEGAIPFEEDHAQRPYDPQQMEDYWQALVRVHNVLTRFRSGFTGKNSPVHFFWGAFDLAVTRFSGRDAPLHQGSAPNMPAAVMQESYSKEVSSCGFWPGSEQYPHVAFYSYCYPGNEAFGQQPVQPEAAFYSNEMGEYLLHYEAVQQADNPEETLLAFLQSTYEACANTAHWDRTSLECDLSHLENEYGCYKQR